MWRDMGSSLFTPSNIWDKEIVAICYLFTLKCNPERYVQSYKDVWIKFIYEEWLLITSYSAYKNLDYILKNDPRIETDIISGHSSLHILSSLVYSRRGMVEVE